MAYTENKLPSGLETKDTPVDADVAVIGDSADSGRAKGTTWENVKAVLKTYFDTVYQATSAKLTSLAGLTPGAEGRLIESDGLGGYQMISASDAVTNAGALMDSEVTNLADVKAFDPDDYATAAQGSTADAALPKAGGTMTGAIVTADHGTATDPEVVAVVYGTSATPPTASGTPIGTLYVQYTA